MAKQSILNKTKILKLQKIKFQNLLIFQLTNAKSNNLRLIRQNLYTLTHKMGVKTSKQFNPPATSCGVANFLIIKNSLLDKKLKNRFQCKGVLVFISGLSYDIFASKLFQSKFRHPGLRIIGFYNNPVSRFYSMLKLSKLRSAPLLPNILLAVYKLFYILMSIPYNNKINTIKI